MKKLEFIKVLVNNPFFIITQIEAEKFTYPAETGEWIYYNNNSKDKAHTSKNQINFYKFSKASDSYIKYELNYAF